MRTKTPCQPDKMLEAAAQLFSSQRFHEVRMEDIAVAAGVGKGTLYRYFRDKDALYYALLTRAAEQIMERLEQAIESANAGRCREMTDADWERLRQRARDAASHNPPSSV